MFYKSSSNKSSQPILETEKLQKLVMELDEHNQASISGGHHKLPIIIIFNHGNLEIQRLQEEFSAEI